MLNKKNTININYGLSKEEINQRINLNLKNHEPKRLTKSYKEIVYDNVFTLFNFINIIMAILVFLTGSYRNMLFMGVVISNIIIGIIQEARSKHILDKLAILTKPKVRVIREGKELSLHMNDLVLDDIMLLKNGDQVCSDAIVKEGRLEMNESLITGESDTVLKEPGDFLYSGSFVVSGTAYAQVEHIGDDNYVHTIMKDVGVLKKYPSQLRNSINFIIKYVSIIIVPLGIMLFLKQYFIQSLTFNEAILGSVAGVLGMIPEGLVLLTSVALAVGSINLARKNTLVQELFCIETLARVDVLCLDKTGTITEGNMKVEKIIVKDGSKDINNILANMMEQLNDINSTASAIREYTTLTKPLTALQAIPFSSERKTSSVQFCDGTYTLGAYEYVCSQLNSDIKKEIHSYTKDGKRVLVLGYSSSIEINNNEIIALLVLSDPIRKEASHTLHYFEKQGVTIKIISGDDPHTVHAIAKTAGVQNYNRVIDMSKISNDELEKVTLNNTVFGRVSPLQKKLMIQALNKHHITAMVGDGVNDVMALKEASCSISVAQGSDAAKNIANLVLLDNDFSNIPVILNEGRRVINNIQRSASLFLVKTTFSMFLCILTLFLSSRYPFAPIQLTLISSLTIGIPSFFLALEANHTRVQGNFLINVFSKALPGALCVILSIIYVNVCQMFIPITENQLSTMCVILTAMSTFTVLIRICIPFSKKRMLLLISMIVLFFIGFFCFGKLFMLVKLPLLQTGLTAAAAICIPILMNLFIRIGSTLEGFKQKLIKLSKY